MCGARGVSVWRGKTVSLFGYGQGKKRGLEASNKNKQGFDGIESARSTKHINAFVVGKIVLAISRDTACTHAMRATG